MRFLLLIVFCATTNSQLYRLHLLRAVESIFNESSVTTRIHSRESQIYVDHITNDLDEAQTFGKGQVIDFSKYVFAESRSVFQYDAEVKNAYVGFEGLVFDRERAFLHSPVISASLKMAEQPMFGMSVDHPVMVRPQAFVDV